MGGRGDAGAGPALPAPLRRRVTVVIRYCCGVPLFRALAVVPGGRGGHAAGRPSGAAPERLPAERGRC
ncbi:hypothetical protein GCM10010206_50250 [Streptomyces cinerochromogenes]|nr:hypothetical protein GCM10010206_50250 [Streptomyces cinerochromogenes]